MNGLAFPGRALLSKKKWPCRYSKTVWTRLGKLKSRKMRVASARRTPRVLNSETKLCYNKTMRLRFCKAQLQSPSRCQEISAAIMSPVPVIRAVGGGQDAGSENIFCNYRITWDFCAIGRGWHKGVLILASLTEDTSSSFRFGANSADTGACCPLAPFQSWDGLTGWSMQFATRRHIY